MCINALGKLSSATGGLLGGGLGIASALIGKKKDKPQQPAGIGMSPQPYGG